MADTNKDDRTTVDVIIEKSVATLDLYEEHLAASRYQQATECLGLLAQLTYQAHQIEDHIELTYGLSPSKDNIEKAYVVGQELRNG
jgi:hypothetical protein